MKKEDEFSLNKEEIPTIKRRSEAAPQRRSIGSVSEDGLIVPAPIKRRTGSEAEASAKRPVPSAEDRSLLKKAEANRLRNESREQLENRPERRALNTVRPMQSAAGQPAAAREEHKTAAPKRPAAEAVPIKTRTVPGANTAQRREAPAAVSRPTVRTAPRPQTRAAEAEARPVRESMKPSAKCGIMPPMYLKDPRQYEMPRKIENGAPSPELIQRHELKYYLNYTDYIILRQKMKGILRLDENAVGGGYSIRSLYFDNIYDQAVSEKESGVQNRHKYRIRIYNCSKNVIKFEKKIKTGDFIAKTSFSMTYREFCMLRDGDIEFLLHKKEALAKEVYLQMRQSLLRPCVVVDYYREPFVMNYETIRITFDSDIRTGEPSWDLFDPALPMMPLLDKGTAVLEVKFAKALPDYIKNIINSADAMQRSAVSKYIICRQYD